jgi:hypothetical protein
MYKHVLRVKHSASTKQVMSVLKKAKAIDRVYNTIMNPITAVEIAWEDLPDMIPFEPIVNKFTQTVPYLQTMFEMVDTFSVDKDMFETCICLLLKVKKMQNMNNHQRSMFCIKIFTFTYKLAWIALACFGIPKTHEHFVCILDYINFVLSNIAE